MSIDIKNDNEQVQESHPDSTFKKLPDITQISPNVVDDYEKRNE